MDWEKIDSLEQLNDLIEKSLERPQLIFKHSSRCSISSMALNRLKSGIETIDLHIVDVIGNREVSNLISQKFDIIHQSPQILLIFNQECIYDASHFNISSTGINKEINLIQKV